MLFTLRVWFGSGAQVASRARLGEDGADGADYGQAADGDGQGDGEEEGAYPDAMEGIEARKIHVPLFAFKGSAHNRYNPCGVCVSDVAC